MESVLLKLAEHGIGLGIAGVWIYFLIKDNRELKDENKHLNTIFRDVQKTTLEVMHDLTQTLKQKDEE